MWTLGRLKDLFLKLGTRDCPLTTALRDQIPKLGITAKFQLFSIKASDPNNQSDWFSVSSNYDLFVLSFADTRIKVRVLQAYDLHKMSSVALCGGLCLTALTMTCFALSSRS
jgi:hypothetical protein